MQENPDSTVQLRFDDDFEIHSRSAAASDDVTADTVPVPSHDLSDASNVVPSPASYLDRFLSSFFDERNIKWLLIVGAAIVFGSSLMLATRQWADWPVTARYLTLLGYTAAGFCVAELGRHRLGLRVTSRVLHGLTLLLLPICFLALSWMSAGTAAQSGISLLHQMFLLIPTAALGWLATGRILDHLLSGRQMTYLISFQLLCLAGILPAAGHPLAAMGMLTALWLVFTTGVVKVNRHVFRLTEEHRSPQVSGFLPIVLSGTQFLSLCCLKCLPALQLHWIGFGSVLVAVTILATARTIADVYRQRTGDLIRPLPWRVVVPMVTGLILTSVGVVFSCHGFPHTYAVVPTAALAAVIMAWTAKDTRHPAFVWLALLFTTIAYQSSPGLFREAALQFRDAAAVAIGEQRLPLAFYGLTYLPLTAVTALAARRCRQSGLETFSRPLQQFSTVLSVVLFGVAFTHPKAMLLVSAVNVISFAGLGSVFRDRRYAVGSLLALWAVVWSVIPGINSMTDLQISPQLRPTLLAVFAAAMAFTGLPDRIMGSIPITDGIGRRFLRRDNGAPPPLAQFSGYLVSGLLMMHWIGTAVHRFGQPLSTEQLIRFPVLLSALVVYSLRHPSYRAGCVVWISTAITALCLAAGTGADAVTLLNGTSIVTTVVSLSGLLLLQSAGQLRHGRSLGSLRTLVISGFNPRSLPTATDCGQGTDCGRGTQRFLALSVPLCDLCLTGLTGLAYVYCLPALLVILFGNTAFVSLPTMTIVIAGLFAAGAISRQGLVAAGAAALSPILVSAVILTAWPAGHAFAVTWHLVIWAAVSAIGYVTFGIVRSAVSQQVRSVFSLGLLIILAVSCFLLHPPLRLAAGIAVAAFVLSNGRRLLLWQRSCLAIVVNIQLLLLAAHAGGFTGLGAAVVTSSGFLQALPLLMLVAAISEIILNRETKLFSRMLLETWTTVLQVMVVLFLCLAFGPAHYSLSHCVLLLCGSAVSALSAFGLAIRRQQAGYIWYSLALPAVSGLWMLRHGFIETGSGFSQLIMLAAAILCLAGSRFCQRHSSCAIAVGPLRITGQSLPAVVALMGLGRVLLITGTLTPGIPTLSLFVASGLYFHLALMTRQRIFAVAALGILNMTLLLLWHSLNLTDAQFYLVPVGLSIIALAELLREQLPSRLQDQLRYLGALTVLVSPVFEILDGSWLHLMTLMVLCVVVILLAIGLRVRALMYTGSAFLVADLVAMVVRSSIDHPGLLWICGVVFGAAVIALAAFCENHRDRLLQRIRYLSAELATWR